MKQLALSLGIALSTLAQPQAFGRFGYSDLPDIPGFEVSRSGFRIRQARADAFRFEAESKLWKPVQTGDTSQTLMLSGVGRSPQKLRADLYGVGFSLFLRNGASFRLSSTQAPYLSWEEGSVGSGVPTPKVKWVLVSFRDAQPPVMLASLSEAQAWQVSGKPGDWRLESAQPFEGWIRVAAPLGLKPFPANSAAALGSLTQQVKPLAPHLSSPIPRLVRTDVVEDALGVEVSWVFDRPGAVVPAPVSLANLGGYLLKLNSEIRRIDSSDPAGPVSVTATANLSVRFPVRRIPTGRAIALGNAAFEPPGSVSHLDIPSVAELALSCMPASRDVQTKELAAEVLAKFLGDAAYAVEPNTNLRLPYGAKGEGLDLAAAHALLMQAAITTQKANSEENSLLTSVVWRRDWRTWTIWSPDPALSRSSAAICAVAGALCAEPTRRLDAAMLEAGLAAQIGLDVWRKRNGFISEPLSKAPLEGLRRALFSYSSKPAEAEAFVRSLLSEIRIYGDFSIQAEAKDGAVELKWEADSVRPLTMILASAYPITVEPKTNLAQCTFENALGFTVIRCTPVARGACEVKVTTPAWAAPLPKAAPPPMYLP